MSGVTRALLAAFVLSAASLTAGDLTEVRARGSLRVLAASDEDAEWFSMAGGEAPGFEREVLEGFARLHRLRFEVVPVDKWEEAIPRLVAGRGDVLAGVNDTEARRKLIAFTSELLPAKNVVVALEPAPVVRSLADLRAARVAVVPHTTWAEAVARSGVPSSRVESVEDVPAALAALEAGRATAAVMDVLDYLQHRRRNKRLLLGLALGEALSSAWGVRKTDPELRDALDAYLVGLKKSPAWSRILVRYFGDDAPAALGRGAPD
jgi:ABC-type amino acid transport substrate-binding protein